jgi:hypothetical protein
VNDKSPPDAAKSPLLPGQAAKDRPAATPAPTQDPAQEARPLPSPPVAPAKRGGALADHLERTRRHPVIVFGIGASGKTTIMMSLVQAINRSGDVNIYLGDPIFPKNHSDATKTHEQAIIFFERHAQKFAMGEIVPPTIFEEPYFIPLDIERKSDGRVVRLAFMEGRGEWYETIDADEGSMFPQFKHDIAEIMEYYGESLSVLWVAPFEDNTLESDLGLVGALNEYRKHRRSVSQDFHLFLLNKWDCHAEPLADRPHFSIVFADMVETLLDDMYPKSWPQYKGLALQTTGRRFFMQYASGHIVGDRVKVPPHRHRAAFDRYPRIVWNWLYGNATQTEVDAEGNRARVILFPDVLPHAPRRVPLFERISRFVLAR